MGVESLPSEGNKEFGANTAKQEVFSYGYSFNEFLNEINTLDFQEENINGEVVKYVQISAMYPLYKQAFGNDAMGDREVLKRITKLIKEDPNNINIKIRSVGHPKFFVNRLNTEILKKLYIPIHGKHNQENWKENELEEYIRLQAENEFSPDQEIEIEEE